MSKRMAVAAIDQGTTGTRCMIFDKSGQIVAADYVEHEQIYPQPGWVEHSATEIWANTERVMEGYRHFASMAKGMGVDFEVIDAAECARRHPLISTDNLIGGLWDPLDGDIDPAQLCQALARRARKAGAEVYRHTPVTGLKQHSDDTWTVETTKGNIDCDVVINACGYRTF